MLERLSGGKAVYIANRLKLSSVHLKVTPEGPITQRSAAPDLAAPKMPVFSVGEYSQY